MTDVAFHFNVADRLSYACRLLRKAVAASQRVLVVAPADTLHLLDEQLWSFSATDFVPHCRVDAPEPMRSQSPVLLAESAQDAPFHDIVLNLGAQVPDGFAAFARVIEVVSLDEEERLQARMRWKTYVAAGVNLVRHDIKATS